MSPAPLVVHLVHGTWARGFVVPLLESLRAAFPIMPTVDRRSETWTADGTPFRLAIDAPARTFVVFEWSGSNSFAARHRAAVDLAAHLTKCVGQAPGARHVVIAHSHGGNVSMDALARLDKPTRDRVHRLVTLATPFLALGGSPYPRIRRWLTLARVYGFVLWMLFPALFVATGAVAPSIRGMITPPLGLALLWSSVLVAFSAATFLLTSSRRVGRLCGFALAVAWIAAMGIVSLDTIATTFDVDASDDIAIWIPHLGWASLAACIAWFVLAWRSASTGAEALRDAIRVAFVVAVPVALVAWRLIWSDDLFMNLAWDAGAVAVLPAFAGGTALASISLLLWRVPSTTLRPVVPVPLLAIRLRGDEATFAINAARLLEHLGGILYRWRWSAVPVAALTTILSPVFFVQGFGFTASAAYGGWLALFTIAERAATLPAVYQLALLAMILGASAPVLSLAATLPLCIAVGPEVLSRVSTDEVTCTEVPSDDDRVTLEVLDSIERPGHRTLRHSAYNDPAVGRRVAAQLGTIESS